MEQHFAAETASEGSFDPDCLQNVTSQTKFTQFHSRDTNHSNHSYSSFQKIEGPATTLHIASTSLAQRDLPDERSMGSVQWSTSGLEKRYVESEPCCPLQESCTRIQTLFAEVIKELEDRIQDCGQLERFPQMEEYGRSRTFGRGTTLVCRLCMEELQDGARWHFEARHYNHFLNWLDGRARKEMRRRRVRLVQHLRERLSSN